MTVALEFQNIVSGKDATDRDLEHRIVSFLNGRHVPEYEQLQVRADSGTVVVRGQLSSDHAKWLCMECCRHVAGVIKLVDEVKVDTPARSRLRRSK